MESIDVDVKRSFNHMEGLTHENLANILKTYAIINTQVNYCQGMNFLAGYLFLAMGYSEELGFGAMREVIERYSLVFLF
jgi:ecotropic viral integration site 5 protein